MEYIGYSKNAAKIRNFRNYKKINNKSKASRNILIIIFLIVVLSMFNNIIFAKTKINTKELTVSQGSTIWNIANSICENNSYLNVQNVVLEIKQLNKLSSSVIYDGQKLIVYEY